jgi:hypothetical protein
MRSSKWLVFIRSRLAGFDRSLTVKSLLRGAEARTPADLITAIGQALAKVTAKDALGWFTSCGYSFG